MSDEAEPTVRVTHGNPSDEELAALTAVLAAKASAARAAKADAGERPSTWAAYWRTARAPQPAAGPDAWRTSALPH